MKVDCYEKGIEKTWQVIKKGGITIFPTDTVYGIGCNPYNINAV
jgi:L-threonylcarbamoyladenylate synthase